MYADSETGLYYWGSRYYDPKTGRSISPDRMSVAEHVQRWQENMVRRKRLPLEINPYVYVANNPLRWIDRTGYFLDDWEPSGPITDDPIRWGLPDIGGCGSTVAQRLILIDNHFGSACKNHDKCYEKCKSNKYICDLQFWEDMKSACNRLSPGSAAYNWCYSKAWNFYEAVSRHGDGSFNNAQKDACSNCTKP